MERENLILFEDCELQWIQWAKLFFPIMTCVLRNVNLNRNYGQSKNFDESRPFTVNQPKRKEKHPCTVHTQAHDITDIYSV